MNYNHYLVYLLLVIESFTGISANSSTNISNLTNTSSIIITNNTNITTKKITSSASKLRTIYNNNWFYKVLNSFS